MARKRASLKDKGAETLGLTPKKGRGIDVLFGGPAEPPAPQPPPPPKSTPAVAQPYVAAAPVSAASFDAAAANELNDLSGLLENPVSQPLAAVPPLAPIPTTPDSLPVNEADDDAWDVITSETRVDDLDLPVAMESPPPDLELATPIAEEMAAPAAPLPEMMPAAETPPPSWFDFLPAAEAPPAPVTPPASSPPAWEPAPVPPPESLAPALEPAPVTPPASLAPAWEPAPVPSPESLAPALEPAMPMGEADENEAEDEDDLAGLDIPDEMAGIDNDDDLAGLVDDAAEPPRQAPSYTPSNLPPGSPPIFTAPEPATVAGITGAAAAPVVPAAPYQTPGYQPIPPAATTTYTPRPFSPRPAVGTPPSTATGAPSLSMPRAKIESVEGFVSETLRVRPEDILPEDSKLLDQVDNTLALKEKELADYDEEMTKKVTRYVGIERRRKLDEDIERLYNEVAQELSVNKEDAEFALKVLSQAQDIVFEDARQYDEAFYLVSVVKTMIARKRNLRLWSYTWGTFVFMYALIWLGFFLTGYVFSDQIGAQLGDASTNANAIRAAWFAALAGGIGGVIGILYSLYWHVAMKQDFDRQYVMYYMVQPVMGFVLGAVVYFIIGSGFLVINFALPNASNTGEVLSSPIIIAIQVVLGWAAGFRQRFVFEMVDKIVQRVSPKEEGDAASKPESLVPEEKSQRIQTRLEEKIVTTPATIPTSSEKDTVTLFTET